jgi:hypothetical protein
MVSKPSCDKAGDSIKPFLINIPLRVINRSLVITTLTPLSQITVIISAEIKYPVPHFITCTHDVHVFNIAHVIGCVTSPRANRLNRSILHFKIKKR